MITLNYNTDTYDLDFPSDFATSGNYCRWRGSSASEPTSNLPGDIWIDTTSTPTTKIYTGSEWIAT